MKCKNKIPDRRILIYNDFEDAQLLNLPILVEAHKLESKVEILVEDGIDKKRFASLMMRVRKSAPHLKFKEFVEIPTEKMNEVERQQEASGSTVIVSEF